MDLPLIVLLCIIPAVAFWISARTAAENATIHGRRACQHAGVQWLDQSVHQVRIRLSRNAEGRLCWERQYRFEYSSAERWVDARRTIGAAPASSASCQRAAHRHH